MQRFDCLAKEISLFGPHFLEASAGTGKTFAIEHIVARLIMSGIDLEQILVVTFTRAATRELKLRIRSNLERIENGAKWDYVDKTERIQDALRMFDRCQIFTIHGFCSRMLKEFAFEAGLQLGFKEVKAAPLDAALRDFFEMGLSALEISPEQLGILVRWAGSVEDLTRKLKKGEKPDDVRFYAQSEAEFKAVLEGIEIPVEIRRESYKKMDGDFEGQLQAFKERNFSRLLVEKNSIFEYTAVENRKVKSTAISHPFFDWGRVHLLPLIERAKDPKEILNTMLYLWKPIEEKAFIDAGVMGPDQLLTEMAQAVQNPLFREEVQGKFKAVLIDEFQDTDPMQWGIFESLFLNAQALYLIGDPKQSIYRFRKADLYTYLKAKDAIAPEGHYHLDTNFRSSKPLIDALNGLFDRQWLHLPKEKKSLPYLPVRAGLDLKEEFQDGKGAVHCIRLEKDQVYAYIAREVIALGCPLSSVAVLVRSRYEAADMQKVFLSAGIASIARSQEPISNDLAFEAMIELFDAIASPYHLGKAKIVLAGPLGGFSAEQIRALEASPFGTLRDVLDEKGLAPMCQKLLEARLGSTTVKEKIGSSFDQMFELLFEWERNNGFSFDGVRRFFQTLEQMDPDEAVAIRKDADEDAVQIMTMHVSKGLEFDIVFILGAGSRTPECDEEAEAEKLRQLYVAMTRAKRRLYVPIPIEAKAAKVGTSSPIELFCRALSVEGRWEEEIARLAEKSSITIEEIGGSIEVVPITKRETKQEKPLCLEVPRYDSSYLLSFTAIAKESEMEVLEAIEEPNGRYTMQNLPRGAETGVIIHKIFERLFLEKGDIEGIVEAELGSLLPWKEAVVAMVEQCLSLELPNGFCLREVDQVRVETEFIFSDEGNFVKGFIDLLFVHQNKLYFLDWKTNWLKTYSDEKLEAAIKSHQYDLQAAIYAEALKREWDGEMGGAIYLFVRGPKALCFKARGYGSS